MKHLCVVKREELEALYTYPYTALLSLLTPPVFERLDFSSPVMLMSVGKQQEAVRQDQ